MDQIKCIWNGQVANDKEFVLVNWQIEFNLLDKKVKKKEVNKAISHTPHSNIAHQR